VAQHDLVGRCNCVAKARWDVCIRSLSLSARSQARRKVRREFGLVAARQKVGMRDGASGPVTSATGPRCYVPLRSGSDPIRTSSQLRSIGARTRPLRPI